MAIQVAVYELKIRKRSKRDSDQKLGKVEDAGDFLKFIKDLMEKDQASAAHSKHESLTSAAKFSKIVVTNRTIQGHLDVGHYGEACPVVDVDSSKKVFQKSDRHADMLPIFFRIDIPKDRDEAILFIQKSRRVRSKSTFQAMVRDPFEAAYPELSLSLELFMPAELFQRYLNLGTVQTLRFTRSTIPPDMVDSYDSGHKEIRGTAELIIKARRNSNLPIKKGLFDFIKSKKPIRDYYTIQGFEYDNVKVGVKLGNRTRNVDIGNRRSAPLWELPNLKLQDGVPTFESISTAVEELRGTLLDQLYSTPE